jgi:lipopolysaccharide transport system ATP-binding protein
MSEVAIRAVNLTKEFTLGARQTRHDTLRDVIADGVASWFRRGGADSDSPRSFFAVKDVSFDVKPGEVVGIVGRNGSGKSTLLKILSRITEPTAGYADVSGRVASLLEVGTGFHGELSGRENIYLNGAILGMRRAEIARKFDDIVEFAEVNRFIDTAVKHYSSGMYVRLAFAVAAHLEPEILLVDEVLAVGDLGFQRKCVGKMGEVARDGRTILFVSHNMAAVQSLCTAAHLLSEGRLAYSGTTSDVVAMYLSSFRESSSVSLDERSDRAGDGSIRFTDMRVESADGTACEAIQSGQDVQFSVSYRACKGGLRHVEMSIDIFAESGQCMLIMNSEMAGRGFESIPDTGRFTCRIDRFPLSPGEYFATLFCRVNGSISDWVQHACVVRVEAGDFFGSGRLPPATHGGFLAPQEWSVESDQNFRARQWSSH